MMSAEWRRVIYADSGWSGFIEVDYDDKARRNPSETAGIKVTTINTGRGRRKTARCHTASLRTLLAPVATFGLLRG